MPHEDGSKSGGRDFAVGYDPRREPGPGRPKSDVRVAEIKGELRVKLAEHLKKYYEMPLEDVIKLAEDMTLSLGDRVAIAFLVQAAKKGEPAYLSMLAKVLGLEAPVKHEIESNTLEELIMRSYISDKPLETKDGNTPALKPPSPTRDDPNSK